MKFIIIFTVLLFAINAIDGQQQCQARYNRSIVGQCSSINSCQGTILAGNTCQQQRCCVSEMMITAPSCLNVNDFDAIYNNSRRSTYLRSVLNRALSAAGICANCQAKAAFLAIAATMTNHFQTDESTQSDNQLAAEDNKYGNNQPGDGSRYRRRGLFGLRGRTMYQRLQQIFPQYQSLNNPESVAIVENAGVIAARLWKDPSLNSSVSSLADDADGTFYGFSMIWYKLTGEIGQLAEATKTYAKFLRQLNCGGSLYPGQGPSCRYNATHTGSCSPDCITGLQDVGEYCGCSGSKVNSCPNSPPHIQCCINTCSQELKMDLGLVLDASGSILPTDYLLQLNFTKDLLRRVNVGRNKTHVAIINYSNSPQVLTYLNTNYTLQETLASVDQAIHYASGTDTAAALENASQVFSYQLGRRMASEGVTPVIFVITDGQSNDRNATIRAAQVLKSQGITVISVGVGSGPDVIELHAVCTPPYQENYFAITNYNALNQKLNQFTSKSCSEPAPVTTNDTVTGEIGKDKYKFLKVEIIQIGDRIQIRVTVLNGNVQLFYSFTNRNPKDPNEFIDYTQPGRIRSVPVTNKKTDVSLVIEKPGQDVQFAYVGIKGLADENKFEVKFEDCAEVLCKSGGSHIRYSSTFGVSLLFLLFIIRFA